MARVSVLTPVSLSEMAPWLCVTITGPQCSKFASVVRGMAPSLWGSVCGDHTGGSATARGWMIATGLYRKLRENAEYGRASEWGSCCACADWVEGRGVLEACLSVCAQPARVRVGVLPCACIWGQV